MEKNCKYITQICQLVLVKKSVVLKHICKFYISAGFIAPKTLNYLAFQYLDFNLMKFIPETRRAY